VTSRPTSPSPPRRRATKVLEALPALLVTAALLAPLGWACWPGNLSEPAVARQVPPIAWSAFGASLMVAGAAAVLAVVLGTVLAALLVLTDLPGRQFWATALVFPFLCPPTVWALGQIYCYGPGGLMERWTGDGWRLLAALGDRRHYLATALVLAQIHAPLAMLIVGRGLGRLHQSGWEAARLFLGPWARVRWSLGAVRQELAAATLLILALSLGNFAVPHVLQCPLYPMEIYLRATNYLDHAGALMAATPLLAAALLATAAVAVAERNIPYATAAPTAPRRLAALGKRSWPACAFLAAYVGLSGLLPLAAVVGECDSPARFLDAVAAAAEETENTLGIAAGAGLVAGAAGLVVGSWAARRAATGVQLAVLIPLGVPTLVLGLAYLQFYNHPWPLGLAALGNTSGLVVLALAARGWPFVTRLAVAGHRRIAAEAHDAARLGGLRGLRKWRWITAPLIAEHVLAGVVVAFVLALGDVELSQMLCAPGSGTLALRLFTFLHFGPAHVAASLALLQGTIAVIPVLAYFLLTNRSLQVV